MTEFLHLVDIINQTDNVESIDGEQKLGQAMVKFSYASRYGTLSAYSLPFFRIRQYHDPKPDGPMPVLLSMTIPAILKAAKDGAPMIMRCAIKIILARSILACLGLTARRANRNCLCPSRPKQAGWPMVLPMLQAHYAYLTQAGLDMQATLGPWLLKLEATQATRKPLFARPACP